MMTYEYINPNIIAKRSYNDSYTENSSPNESPTQPPKIPILNSLQNYFTTKSSSLLQHTNNINDGKTTKRSTTTKKTATLLQKIKTATTLKLQKLSKRLESKKKININHHRTIPHQQPYSLRPRLLATVFFHNSITSSDHDSSSSSSFSSQNCSTISDQPAHQSISHSPQSNHSRDSPGLGGTFCDIGGYNFYFLWIDIKTYKNMSE